MCYLAKTLDFDRTLNVEEFCFISKSKTQEIQKKSQLQYAVTSHFWAEFYIGHD
jgi:hypothetical protein